MAKTTKEEVIKRLGDMERPYKTSFEPTPHLRKDIAEVLTSPDFRNLNELVNKAVGDFVRDWKEKKKLSDEKVTID